MNLLKKIILIMLLFGLCACNDGGIRRYHTYTVYPTSYILNRVGGNRIETKSIQENSIIENAVIVNDYEEILADSLYFYHVGNLEPYLDIYHDDVEKSGTVDIDLSSLNAIYKFQRYTYVNINGVENYVESPYYDGDAFKNSDSYDFDLFLWLDPIGMLSMAKTIYQNLASNYVEQSAYFKENYENLEADLISLDAAYHNLATSIRKNNKTIKFVSMTPSFGSWQKAYGFAVYPVCLSKYGALPTDEQLAIIKQRIKDDDVRYIAYEPNMSSEMSALFSTLETELGLKRVNLSNLSSLTPTQESDGKDYLTIMYENLSVLENIATSSVVETFEEVKE